jgi:protein-S-isoprenylcysteine O-methyltransferase Ste14
MGIVRVLLAAEWALFVGIWIACSFTYRKSSRKKSPKGWLLYPCATFLLMAVFGYLGGDFLLISLSLPGYFEKAVKISGIALVGGGLSFAIWARINLASNWVGYPSFIEGQTITKKGPYALVRHPIYTGVIAMLWGSFLTEGFFFLCIMAFVGTALLYMKARLEEALLSEYMGDEYRIFVKTSPMLVPSFHKTRSVRL